MIARMIEVTPTRRRIEWAGLWLNLIGVGLIVALTYAIIVPLLVD